MNTYVTSKLQEITQALRSTPKSACIEPMGNELEMIRMEIEQHLGNMPATAAYCALRASAEDAVQKLNEAFPLWEELFDTAPEGQEEILAEMISLIEQIEY